MPSRCPDRAEIKVRYWVSLERVIIIGSDYLRIEGNRLSIYVSRNGLGYNAGAFTRLVDSFAIRFCGS